MPELDRIVAGIRCREVLADLSAFLDNELAEARVRQIEAHLRECDWCERFGGEFSNIIRSFRQTLAQADPLDRSLVERLSQRIQEVASEG